jgi:hypothetical protein
VTTGKATGRMKLIGISGDTGGDCYRSLFEGLGQLFPVVFRNVTSREFEGFDAFVVLDGDLATGLAAASAGVPSYLVMSRASSSENVANRVVQFSSAQSLDPCFRDQQMVERETTRFCPIKEEAGDEVLACVADQPIWLGRPTEGDVCQIVGVSPPPLRENEFLFQYLNGRKFIGLLPFMHFLRRVVKAADWERPPSRACFIFDDPSLYWRSYGFLNFQDLSKHAMEHDYFASIATIPLDSWWVNSGVAATLRSSSPRLSVLIHGNNHTTQELLRENDSVNCRALAAQAMQRMQRLKTEHDIFFFSIMEAPHGALSKDVFQELLLLGYEAALSTTELLVRHNRHAAWPLAFGMDRTEILGGGLPVIPRIKMSIDWKNDVLLAAFLRQPIVVAGHHYDVAEGMDILAELAATVNRLEGVAWSDLRGILQTNYVTRVEKGTLIIKMFARAVTVPVPPGVDSISVVRPWIEEGKSENLVVTANGRVETSRGIGPFTDALSIENASTVEIASEIENPVHFSSVPKPRQSIWPIARKILMEIRDRLSPALASVEKKRDRRVRECQ